MILMLWPLFNKMLELGMKFLSALFSKVNVKGVEWIKKVDEAEKKVQACFKKCVKNAV